MLLNTFYVPDTLLNSCEKNVQKQARNILTLIKLYSLVWEKDSNYILS